MLIDLTGLRDWFFALRPSDRNLGTTSKQLNFFNFLILRILLENKILFFSVLELQHQQEDRFTKELMAMQHFQDPALQPRPAGQRPLVLHNNNQEQEGVVYQAIHKVPHWRQIRGSLSRVTDHQHPALTSLDRSGKHTKT